MPVIVLSSNFTQSSYIATGAIDRVLGDLGYRDSNFVTTGDVLAWLNEGQMILARETKCFHVTTASGVTSGTAEYPLPSESTARCIAVEEVLYDGDPLPFITNQQLYAHYPRWREAAPSTPLWYYMRGNSVIGLYPTPDTSTSDILTITYTALPPDVTSPLETFKVMHGAEDLLLVYAKLCASIKDQFGEGKERIPMLRERWERGLLQAGGLAKSVTENEVVRIGENGLMGGQMDPFFISPETLAVSL
jgi:hypothetical protein